jgi:hypothetical protein
MQSDYNESSKVIREPSHAVSFHVRFVNHAPPARWKSNPPAINQAQFEERSFPGAALLLGCELPDKAGGIDAVGT